MKPINEKYSRDDDADSRELVSQSHPQHFEEPIFQSRSQPRRNAPKLRRHDIILDSKRGTGIGEGYCDSCGYLMGCLTHYAESNVGPVNIFQSCKAKIRDRSFGYIDIFTTKRVIGGFRW